MKLATLTALAVLIACGCKPTASQMRAAAVVGAYEAALDTCIATSKTYQEYAACADLVDQQFQLTHTKTGDQQ